MIDPRRRAEGTSDAVLERHPGAEADPRSASCWPPATIAQFPGAFNPLSARLIEEKGFAGVYISGAVLANDLGLPDIGLTTLTEVAARGRADRPDDRPARRSSTPTPGSASR